MNEIIPIQTNIHYNPIQALINLPMGLIKPDSIKPEDYYNFKDILDNSLLVIDSEYIGMISSVTKSNRLKFMIEHHSILPNDLRISNLKAQLNEFFTYNKKDNEEIPVYIVGHKLFNIYKPIIDVIHVTAINSHNSHEINDFWNMIIDSNYEKTLSRFMPGSEIIDDDPEVISSDRDYIIYEKPINTEF